MAVVEVCKRLVYATVVKQHRESQSWCWRAKRHYAVLDRAREADERACAREDLHHRTTRVAKLQFAPGALGHRGIEHASHGVGVGMPIALRTNTLQYIQGNGRTDAIGRINRAADAISDEGPDRAKIQAPEPVEPRTDVRASEDRKFLVARRNVGAGSHDQALGRVSRGMNLRRPIVRQRILVVEIQYKMRRPIHGKALRPTLPARNLIVSGARQWHWVEAEMGEKSDYVLAMICPHCGMKDHAHFGQTVVDDKLRWYRSTSCPVAGNVEEDGLGGGPDILRDELLQIKGLWSIHVKSPAKLLALRVVKQALHLTTAEALTFFLGFPILSVGTRAEAEWLAKTLEINGIAAETGTVQFELREPTESEIPDIPSAMKLLDDNHIDLKQVYEVSHFHDGSMSIVLNSDGALSHFGIEFDPDRSMSLSNAFFALGVPVRRVRANEHLPNDSEP